MELFEMKHFKILFRPENATVECNIVYYSHYDYVRDVASLNYQPRNAFISSQVSQAKRN